MASAPSVPCTRRLSTSSGQRRILAPLKRHEPKAVVRFETPPGVQITGNFTVVRRGRDPLPVLVAPGLALTAQIANQHGRGPCRRRDFPRSAP